MNARLAFLALGAGLVAAAPAPDVDVVVSAGTPFDWLADLSRPTPSRSRSVPGAGFDRSTVVEVAPRVFSTDVYRFAKITTVDLIGEIPWTVRRDVPTPGRGTPTPGGSTLAPPERVSDDVLWLGLALLLKRALHPALVGAAETEEYLVHLGEGALLAVRMGGVDPAVNEICSSVASRVGHEPTPVPLPRVKAGLEGMLQRLVVEDLAGAYPFAFDGRFGARLALLGDEMVVRVIEATRARHPFLRRNATLMLGRYPSASAAERLRELLGDKDAVVQSRALEALARRRDRDSVPVLLEMLKRRVEWPSAPGLVRALGEIGDPRALGPLRALLKGGPADYELVLAAVTALVRLTPAGDDEHLRLLDRLEALSFDDPKSPYRPVTQDLPGTRNAVLKQLLLLGRARAGHAASAAEVLARMSKGAPPGAPFFARGGMRSPLLAAWHPPAIYPLLETLRSIPGGDVPLMRIAADRAEDVSVRIRALAELARINPPGLAERVGALVSSAEEFSVARSALHVLAALAGPAAVARAKACVDEYSPGQDAPRKALVAEAVQVLAGKNALDPAAVARMVECEIILHERGQKRPAPPPAPPARGGLPTTANFESPVSYLEDLLLALGPCTEDWSRALLRDVLALPGMTGRAEAAVALAASRDPADAPLLLAALKDRDPWLRFMAYRSLKHVLGKDAPCDWLYGSESHRAPAVAKYAQWVKELAD